jgi:hypothetical protein
LSAEDRATALAVFFCIVGLTIIALVAGSGWLTQAAR